jgi:glycosyltransferase involved in cell wall biosynthesis
MRILFCCQFYAPSVGGVQELIRQIAERLVARGHQVTVATSSLPNRDFDTLNGVVIQEFAVTGNLASGMSGEIREYQDFIVAGQFDVMLVYAAQQWTFDALWPILDRISYRKVFFPSGFSGLYEPGYAKYFREMPEILQKFDHLVFNTSKYRDIDFARAHGLEHYSVIPNGASEEMFNVPADPSFRARHGIPEQSFLFLTVGSFTGLKGHLELARAFQRLRLPEGRHATLILNGNEVQVLESSIGGLWGKLKGLVRTHGLRHAAKRIWQRLFGMADSPKRIAEEINRAQPNKRVLITDFPRKELTQAFMAADLFVFASNIEYSPLVLYECAAAGTPFLTVDVGNAVEIAQWTEAGVVCPSHVDKRGYTRVDEGVLAREMEKLMGQEEKLAELGAAGKRNWLERLTWGKIAIEYERLFLSLQNGGRGDNINSILHLI